MLDDLVYPLGELASSDVYAVDVTNSYYDDVVGDEGDYHEGATEGINEDAVSELINGENDLAAGLKKCKENGAVVESEQAVTEVGVLDWSKVPEFLRDLIKGYEDCFVEVSGLGRVTTVKHHITIKPGEEPVKARPFKMSWQEQQELDKQLKQMVDMDLIKLSPNGAWSSPCFFIKKKTGELRLVIDYRKLNAKTVDDMYTPLPNINDLLDSLGGAKYFSTVDCAQGYYQIAMEEDSIEKTGFVTPNGNRWVFKVMAPPFVYQSCMMELLHDFLGVFLYIFIDDVIVFSRSEEEHKHHIELVLQRFASVNLKLKFKKCHFGVTDGVEFLGHMVTPQGVLPNKANVEKVLNYPKIYDQTSLRGFMGMIKFYARFLPNLADVAHPLFKLLKKNVPFVWGKEQDEACEKLKMMLRKPPLLSYPDKDQIQILTTDGSTYCIAGILSQVPADDPSKETVIAYKSRSLRGSETRYSQVHIEALAIVYFTNMFSHYLAGKRFILRTDNAALKFILKPDAKVSAKLSRWAACLSGFDFVPVLIKSKDNPADGLSRAPE